jgi:uncharacterized protein (UPF0276 family)
MNMMHMTQHSSEGVVAPSGFPEQSGVSLKPRYYQTILETQPQVGFFEIHAENYLSPGGPAKYYLEKIREIYPITVHGVGLSIGGEQPLDPAHLNRIAELVAWIEPIVFSEHLAWSSHNSQFFNDLLPLPYTQKTLRRVCEHIDQVQERLKRPTLLENPSTYFQFNESTLDEQSFIAEIVRQTGCRLLLDVNNVEVSCFNQSRDPYCYLENFPLAAVSQLHLAGYALDENDVVPLKIDAHDREVCSDVWQLYRHTLQQLGDCPTLIEWDGQLPKFSTLHQQAQIADQIRTEIRRTHARQGDRHAASI